MRTNDWGSGDVQVSGGGPGSGPAARGGAGRELTPERIAEVRRHVLEGAYRSAEVAGRVAEGILRSGHL